MLRSSEIRRIVEENGGGRQGRTAYLDIQDRLLNGVTLPNGVKEKRHPSEFSLRGLWEGLVGPVEETLATGQNRGYNDGMATIQEEVSTGSFASATGQLIGAAVIEGYDSVTGIGDRLVTTMPSNLRDERIVGFTHIQGPKVVVEGEPYVESDFADKYVTTQQSKKGRLLSVTEEAVIFDQTGQVLMRAQRLGESTAEEKERTIVRGCADVLSTERVYRPSGTAEQYYSSGNANLFSTATPLVDWTDVQEVLAWAAANVIDDRATDDTMSAQPIAFRPRQLLTAMELVGTAQRIVSATVVGTIPGSTAQAGMDTVNPIRLMGIGQMEALASPYLDVAAADSGDDQYTDASDWFIGDFPKDFIWKEIIPVQTLRAPANDPESFERDIVARYKVRYYGGLNAVDTKHVIQVNAA